MRYDAVLFDLDGTLTDSAPGICGSVRHTIGRMGYPPIDGERLSRFVGPPLHDSFREYTGMDEAQSVKAVAIYREHYTESGLLDASVFPGIPNLLRRLKAEGAYLAIATAKPAPFAYRVLEHFGLLRFFDTVVGASFDRRDASKADILRDALPARYSRAAMLGDRRYDMEAAKETGIDAIGAGWGYGSDAEFLAAGTDAVAETVQDAARLLLSDTTEEPRGFFITIEGLDGSGKTTQMNAVAEYIKRRGYEVLTTREPGGTPISEEIRSLVLDPDRTMCAETEALLFAASRAQHVRGSIRPALARGAVVLCDRFVDASIAYQGAGRELGMDKVAAINAFAIGGTMPDLTLLFVVDAQTALLRRSAATALDRIERTGEAFYQRVYDAFVQIADTGGNRVKCIDARRSIDAVTADACAQVDALLASR